MIQYMQNVYTLTPTISPFSLIRKLPSKYWMKDLKISTLSSNLCKILYYYGPKQQRQKYQNSIYRGQSQSDKTHRQRKIDATNLPLYEEISRNRNLQGKTSY